MAVQYKFVRDRVVAWPVSVPVPLDGGKVEQQTFEAWFALIDATEQAAIEEASRAPGGHYGKALMARVFRGFSGVDGLEDDGPDARALLLAQPAIMVAMITAFFEAATGKAHEKN